jgi:hypothetical protein
MSKKQLLQIVTHHRRNPLDFNCMDLAEVRTQCRAPVLAVLNLSVLLLQRQLVAASLKLNP